MIALFYFLPVLQAPESLDITAFLIRTNHMLIVSCIKKKFGTKISTPDLCPLRNEGFTGFQTLLEKAFDQEAITSDDWNAILKSDDYLQLPRIQKLWNTISSSELLADRHKAQGLLDNLCKSEFNIIASYSNDVNITSKKNRALIGLKSTIVYLI